MDLEIPEGTFSMAELEKANAGLGAAAFRTQFAAALVDGLIEVVETIGTDGKAFLYRKNDRTK